MKKLIPNPEYEKAKLALGFIWGPEGPPTNFKQAPEIRTNNPNYLTDGCRMEDQIPSHIEVEVEE